MKKLLIAALAAASTIGLASTAASAATSFTLTIAPGQSSVQFDTPLFTLSNTSTTEFLTGFSLSFASGSYNVDVVNVAQVAGNAAPAIGTTVNSPSPNSNGPNGAGPGRTNGFSLSFTGFNPGDGLQIKPDFDPNYTNANDVDYRTFLFAATTTVTAMYNNGTSLSLVLDPADKTARTYTFSAPAAAAAVPEPATWAMMLTGFGLVGISARRRKPSLQTA